MTCQSYLSYVHLSGVTKWPTQACTIPVTTTTAGTAAHGRLPQFLQLSLLSSPCLATASPLSIPTTVDRHRAIVHCRLTTILTFATHCSRRCHRCRCHCRPFPRSLASATLSSIATASECRTSIQGPHPPPPSNASTATMAAIKRRCSPFVNAPCRRPSPHALTLNARRIVNASPPAIAASIKCSLTPLPP